MHRLGLLVPVCLCLLAPACAKDNPAFDDCETDASCLGESESRGDGDGDTGDGDPGDGDGDPGDGDGDAGDGDGDTGDGDGDADPLLPTCPDSTWVSMPVKYDTFLDSSSFDGQGCITDWDFELDQPVFGNGLCGGLDFGASPGHSACGGNTCISAWLGKFDLSEWNQVPVQVVEAGFAFTARYKKAEMNAALAYELDVTNVNFNDCADWHAGPGMGVPPAPCATTFSHAAFPHPWGAAPTSQLLPSAVIAAAPIPPTPNDAYVDHYFFMPVDPLLIQAWLSGLAEHRGVLVNSSAGAPTEFYLFAQESNTPPELKARMCLP
jgi:hypothetical protein